MLFVVTFVTRDAPPQIRPDLKLIVMSATLQLDMFVDYFPGCAVIHISGFVAS